MTNETIRRLNQLNQQFYNSIATEFSHTRSHPWSGWRKLYPHLAWLFDPPGQAPAKYPILDVGCGNGRFAPFLAESYPHHHFQYLGIDSNQALLTDAQQHQKALSNLECSFEQLDIVEALLNHQNWPSVNQQFKLITMFGVLHHIPSLVLRQQLLTELAQKLLPNGLLILSTWQFVYAGNLMKRRLQPEQLGFDAKELEPNDFFLTWERGKSEQRYCHWVNDLEITNLIQKTEFERVDHFSGEGNDQLNSYLVLRR